MLQKVIGEPEFRVRCLGGLSLMDVRSGTDMTPAKRKPRALLAYLCIEQKPVGRERLVALLWGDRGDEQARANLRQALYELRSPLGGDRLLRTEGDSVVIGESVSTDIVTITMAAQSGDLEQLRRAFSEWSGEIFEDLSSIDVEFDGWLETARLHIQETLIDAGVQAVKAAMARGEIDAARPIVSLLQERDRTNEPVLRLGLTLDHLAGDAAALHRRYERFKKLLKSDLDATPSTETQRLFHELAAGTSAPLAGNESLSVGNGASEVTRRVRQTAEADILSPARPLPSLPAAQETPEKSAFKPSILRGSAIRAAGAASTVLALAAFVWLISISLYKPAPPRAEPLLAVLPFQNLGIDAGSQFFSDGITEDIVDALLRITQIRVASTNSSFQFRNASAPETAKALAATHLLSGSVRRDGDRIKVLVQLTDARNNRVIWSGAYTRTMTEIPALQHDIAVEIANALDMRLSPTALDEARSIDPDAYGHYLKGRDMLFQRNHDAAITELTTSIRLAPGFAKAWSSLSAARLVLASEAVGGEDYDDAMARTARAAARRALVLDPNNGEALAVMAWLTPSNRQLEIDRLLQRALQSEPNNAELLNLYGEFLIFVGRRREAVSVLTQAYELDRMISSVAANLVAALLDTGAYEKAGEIMALNQDNKLQREFLRLHAVSFLYRQDWSGMAKYLSVMPQYAPPRMAAFLDLWRETASALEGHDAASFDRLRLRWRSESPLDPDEAALFLSDLGYPDDALEVVEKAVKSNEKNYLLTDPEWDALFVPGLAPLRQDTRVPGLVAQWGLFNYWRTTNRWPDFCEEPTLAFDCKAEARKFMPATARGVAKHS